MKTTHRILSKDSQIVCIKIIESDDDRNQKKGEILAKVKCVKVNFIRR